MAKTQNAITPMVRFKEVLNSQTIRAMAKNSLKENSGVFLSSVVELVESDRGLQECDPTKVINEAMKAAFLGLPLVKSLGFAYVVPFKSKGIPVPTFMLGYKGYIQLAQRSGFYRHINSDVVFEGEITARDKLSGEVKLDGAATSGKIVGYFAYFKLLNGFEKTLYMSKEEIAAHGKRFSRSYSSATSVWQTDFDSMALKTVIRLLISKFGPMSTELAKAIAQDEGTESVQEKVSAEIAENANLEPIDVEVIEIEEEEEIEEEPQEEDSEEQIDLLKPEKPAKKTKPPAKKVKPDF